MFQGKIEDQITLIHIIVNNREFRMNQGHNLLCQILSQNAEKIVRNPIGNAIIRKVLEDGDKYSENDRDIRIILKIRLNLSQRMSIKFKFCRIVRFCQKFCENEIHNN